MSFLDELAAWILRVVTKERRKPQASKQREIRERRRKQMLERNERKE